MILANFNFHHLLGFWTTRRIALVILTILAIFRLKGKLKPGLRNINIFVVSVILFSILMSVFYKTLFIYNYQLAQFIFVFYALNIIHLVRCHYNIIIKKTDIKYAVKFSFILYLAYLFYLFGFEDIKLSSIFFLRYLSVSSPYFNLNIFMNGLVVITIGSMVSKNLASGREKLLLVIISMFLISLVVMSFSRQSIFGVMLPGFYMFLRNMRKSWYLILLAPLILYFQEYWSELAEALLSRFETGGDSKRLSAYRYGFQMFLNNPLGTGLGNYTFLTSYEFNVLESAHLQILVELGLFYFVFYIIGVRNVFKRISRVQNRELKTLSYSVFISIFWMSFFNEIFFTTLVFIPLYFLYTHNFHYFYSE